MKQRFFTYFLLLLTFSQNQLVAERVAFFYALSQDIAAFEKLAGPPITSTKIGESSIQTYLVGKHRIYAAKMGSGSVQTAVTAQALLTQNRCDLVISCGPAGGLGEALKVGEWVVANKAVAFQKGSVASSGFSLTPQSEIDVAAPDLVALLPEQLPKADIASGELFVASDDYRRELSSLTNCSLVEMNLFGLATAMRHHDLVGIHLRVVSDLADANASRDFRSFAEKYDGRGGSLVYQILENLPSSGLSPVEYPNLRRLLE
ncbi:MAG: hypothetical protein GVY36_17885 [Verrucomicrobia bacterium]|jgi:nucleoside phosphorylase|nr:hypothetical protein [Verrucomicrobiota bacterium]